MHFEVAGNVNRCLAAGEVLEFEAEKFFCWTLFRHNIPCQFFCHFVHLPSAAYIVMTDELANCPTVGKNHIDHHKTLARVTFYFLLHGIV